MAGLGLVVLLARAGCRPSGSCLGCLEQVMRPSLSIDDEILLSN